MYKKNIKKILSILVLLGVAKVTLAQEIAPKFSIDIGYADLNPSNDNGDIQGPGIPPNASVDVRSTSFIGMTLNYHQNSNISYQLYLGAPISLDIDATGSLAALGKIATADVLPPIFFVNYTFDNYGRFKPYLGLGLNYTSFGNEKSTKSLEGALGGTTTVDVDNSWGGALQAGLKYNFKKSWYVNASYMWINVDTKAKINTAGIIRDVKLGLDPSMYYISIGYLF